MNTCFKYKFLSFKMKGEFDNLVIGDEFDSDVSAALSEYGVQGYEVQEVHYDGDILFIFMCYEWDPKKVKIKPKKKKVAIDK